MLTRHQVFLPVPQTSVHACQCPQVRDQLQTQHRDALGQRNLSRLLRELGVLAKGGAGGARDLGYVCGRARTDLFVS